MISINTWPYLPQNQKKLGHMQIADQKTRRAKAAGDLTKQTWTYFVFILLCVSFEFHQRSFLKRQVNNE